MLKKILPPELRIQLRVTFTRLKDLLNGHYFSFQKRNANTSPLPRQFSLSQPIRKNDYSENKKHNLKLAIEKIQNRILYPQKIFSYWHLIPQPIKKNGFKKGRNLVANQLALDYGGGLCQLSGIMFHLALEAGLEIMERHPHSLDIYTEETRYCPIGSDATVVFGHKDLRIKNNYKFPISFEFEILENEMKAYICSEEPIQKWQVDFFCEENTDGKTVKVIRTLNGKEEICSEDFYKNMK